MAKEEKYYTKEIGKKLTDALNSKKSRSEISKALKQTIQWPPEPTKEVLKQYERVVDAEWKKLSRGYDFLDVDLSVKPGGKGKNPSVLARVSFPLNTLGGGQHAIAPGDTLMSISQTHYGYPHYWDQIADANTALLGKKPQQLPVGFKLKLPKLDVPPWATEPPMTKAPWSSIKAVKVLHPTLEVNWKQANAVVQHYPVPPLMVQLKWEFSSDLKIQKAGNIDIGFNLKTYEIEAAKAVKSMAGEFKTSATLDGKSGKAEIGLAHKDLALNMTRKITLTPDASFKISFKKDVKTKYKGFAVEGTVTASVSIKIYPIPSKVRVRVPEGKPVRVPWEPLAIVAAVVIVGVIAVSLVPSGGGSAALAPALLTSLG
ncbi:MAG: LysM peptidoglycan-binding domain-containing protein [Phycisphaerales bacterium JB040]